MSLGFGAFLNAAQLMAPETGKRFSPFVEGANGLGVGAVEHAAAIAAGADEADIL